ncbi:MAG: cbb3-type cytochrome c oxidase subunit II [Deferribacterales bacterium]
MSNHENSIYSKALVFSVLAAVTVLIGTIVTVFLPMFTSGMHPKTENLTTYTALQLAGKDIYMSEGCVNCHTQTVRPLKADVLRYGDYSKAGEFAYDRPFLWGSKRTGPDLARIGGKYPDEWHIQHFENPQAFYPKSNMPKYPWLKTKKLNPAEIKAHMDTNGFPYTEEEMAALADQTQLDALVAYMQVIGASVAKKEAIVVDPANVEQANPMGDSPEAVAMGQAIFKAECAGCHGQNAEGNIGASIVDYAQAGNADADTYVTVANGFEGAMPSYAAKLSKDKIWSVVSYINSLKQ